MAVKTRPEAVKTRPELNFQSMSAAAEEFRASVPERDEPAPIIENAPTLPPVTSATR
jgi:hypothetical protein